MRLYLIRHAESEGNRLGIIQGQRKGYGLSKAGVRASIAQASSFKGAISKGCIFITSDLKRALETARIFSAHLDSDLVVDPSLREVHPGILQGKRKASLKPCQALYLECWDRRGDLDDIPGAETGDQLQSRVLAFLARTSLNGEDNDYMVFTHAAYMRCFVNTVKGRPRCTAVPVENLYIHTVDSPWEAIECSEFSAGFNSRAWHIVTADSEYVLKIVENVRRESLSALEKLHKLIRTPEHTIPALYYWRMWDPEAKFGRAILVYEYLPGTSLGKKVSVRGLAFMVQGLYAYHQRLLEASKNISTRHFSTLSDRFRSACSEVRSRDLKQMFGRVSRNSAVRDILRDKELVLVDFDVHLGNMLTDGRMFKKIDIGVTWAPRIMQPASFLLAGCMLEDPESFDIRSYADIWPDKYSERQLLAAMMLRAVYGLSFFDRATSTLSLNKQNEARLILARYIKCLDKLLHQ